MSFRIRIYAGSVTVEAELNESQTAKRVWDALPIEGIAHTWGEEVYFKIPVDAERERDARDIVEKGEIGYWPMGQAFCIFFGPTPASQGDEIRAYSAVNILGRIIGDPTVFKDVQDGDQVKLDKIESV